MALRIFRFRRFSTQLLLLLAGLFTVVQLSVYLLISQANERNALEHIEQNLQTGAKIYKDRCESCHQAQGEGIARIYPPLANNQSITMRNPVNSIRIVLNGGFPPSTEGNQRPYGMPPFYQDLSDEQIAAVVTYIRQSWGNAAPPAAPIEVGRSRGVPVD